MQFRQIRRPEALLAFDFFTQNAVQRRQSSTCDEEQSILILLTHALELVSLGFLVGYYL
jgi:hypothetical protein